MYTHVTVLTTGAIASAGRIDGNVVQWTEMASDSADLLLEDLVEESCLKLSLSG